MAELRHRARLAWAAAELAAGHHEAIVADLVAWVAEGSPAGPLLNQLMLALHRCGRDAEALAAYETHDGDGEGEAAALAAAIRRHDPTLGRGTAHGQEDRTHRHTHLPHAPRLRGTSKESLKTA